MAGDKMEATIRVRQRGMLILPADLREKSAGGKGVDDGETL